MNATTTLTLLPLPCPATFERYPLRRSYSLPLGRPCFQCGMLHSGGETSCTNCDVSLCESRTGWFSVALWRSARLDTFPDHTAIIRAPRPFPAIEALMRVSALYRAHYVTARALDGSIIYHRLHVRLFAEHGSRQDNDEPDDGDT